MRFGVCAGFDRIPLAKEAGFDYAEGNLGSISKMSEEDFNGALKLLKEYDIKLEATNCFFPGEILVCGETADIKLIADYIERAMSRAVQLGVETTVLGSGRSRRIPEGFDRKRAHEQLLETFWTAGETAKKYGITIAIEPLNSNECNVLTTVGEAGEFSEELNHPNVLVLADLYHVVEENESFENLVKQGGKLHHIHFNNPVVPRVYPKLTDEYDYSPFVDALKKCGFNGRMSIEAGCKDFAVDGPEALDAMKVIFADFL